MSESSALFERAKKVAPGGVHSPVRSFKSLDRPPVFFNKASGAFLWDVDGNKYIDFCQSFGPLILGHRDPEIQAGVEKMISTAWSFGACEPYSLELAEWLQQKIPWLEKLRFVSSGTEATMSAIRVARAATKKNKILKFDGCYHGHVDSLLVEAGSGLAGEASSTSAGIPEAMAKLTVVAKLDDEENFNQVFKTHLSDLAAVIIEPLPANYGLLIQRTEFLQHIAKKCRENNVLLILDEVISGFRIGIGGMAAELNIIPDLVCYGKILGGGFPVGCYGGRADLMDLVAPMGPVYQAGTLSANPVGMRAGLLTLQKMTSVDGWTKIQKNADNFYENLKSILKLSGLTVSHYKSLFWIHEHTDNIIRNHHLIPKGQSQTFKRIFTKALDHGIYLAPHAYEVGFLSLAHTEEVLNDTCQILKKVVNEN